VKRNLHALLALAVFTLVFTLAIMLMSYFAESWAYLFGGGLLLVGIVAYDYRGSRSWTLSVLLCFAAGMISSPVILAYPVTEIFGLYLAIALLIAGSAWWWRKSPPMSPR
jgi:hypothetical protein